jgi:hypothetical protein
MSAQDLDAKVKEIQANPNIPPEAKDRAIQEARNRAK